MHPHADNALPTPGTKAPTHPLVNNEQIESIYSMLQTLASVCDNAESRDGAGFSKTDLIGHYIAELPYDYFDDNWAMVSLTLIRKYQKQLSGFGFDVEPYLELLRSLNKEDVKTQHKNRSSRQQRRILLTEAGDFEVYFPNKRLLPKTILNHSEIYEWINKIEIPHGYQFVVKRGAREYVESLITGHDNWLIPDHANEQVFNPANDTIDVSNAMTYDLYIYGESLDEQLTFKWDNLYQYLELVKTFSNRQYNGAGAWYVTLKTPEDLALLRDIYDSGNVYLPKSAKKELDNFDAKHQALVEVAAARKKQMDLQAKQNKPQCRVIQVNNVFHLSFTQFSYDFVNWIKSNLNEKRYSSDKLPHWEVTIADDNIIALSEKLSDGDWLFDDATQQLIKAELDICKQRIDEKIRLKETSLSLSYQLEPDDDFSFDTSLINGTLYPFQETVLQYNSLHKNMYIGDDMGVGKTLSSLACAAINQLTDSVTITCLAIARLSWRNEINQWLPEASVYICKRANSKRMAAKEREDILASDFVITSFNKLTVYQEILIERQDKLFIADEGQYLKNPKTQRTRAAMKISDSCQYIYILSGTPLKNRPIELIPQLKMLRVLDSEFGGETKFLFTYCDPVTNKYGTTFKGASNLSDLRKKLRESCMIRRLKDDVMKFLPPKRRIRIPVDISNRKEYDTTKANFIQLARQNVKDKALKQAVSNKLTGIKKNEFVRSYVEDSIKGIIRAAMLVHINMLRKIVSKGLCQPACDWIEDFCSNGNPLVVFSYHKEQQRYIFNTLKKDTNLRVGRIVAGATDEQRKQVETDFQAGLYDVLIVSVMIGKENITLTRATTCFIVEYLWTPTDHTQAEDRIRRIGTSEKVSSIDCVYLHAENTVDDHFWSILVDKFDVIGKTFDSDDIESFDMEGSVKSKIIDQMMMELDIDSKVA